MFVYFHTSHFRRLIFRVNVLIVCVVLVAVWHSHGSCRSAEEFSICIKFTSSKKNSEERERVRWNKTSPSINRVCPSSTATDNQQPNTTAQLVNESSKTSSANSFFSSLIRVSLWVCVFSVSVSSCLLVCFHFTFIVHYTLTTLTPLT